jgi:hypothetical protein
VVTLPADAAQAIAKQLHSNAPAPPTARYVSPEAHDAYPHGRYLWFEDKNELAGEFFRKATELQPDYAPGWAGLSMYFTVGALEGDLDPSTRSPQQKRPPGRRSRWTVRFPRRI